MTLIKELQINIAMSNYNQRSSSYSEIMIICTWITYWIVLTPVHSEVI